MIVFLLLSFLSYVFAIFYLYWWHDIFGSIVSVFFLYIFSHFLSLDIKRFKLKYLIFSILGLIILDLIVLFVFWINLNTRLIVSVIMLNLALFALFVSLDAIQFRSIPYFLRWWYTFTLFITITYSLALIWLFQKFPLTCEWLQSASHQLIEFVEKPFKLSINTISSLNSHQNIDKISVDKKDLDQKVEDVLLLAKDTEVQTNDSFWSPIAKQFNTFKAGVVDQIMWQQNSYSKGMCDMLLDEIHVKYDLSNFKLSAVILIYLLLFWFVRVAIFIMSFIWFLLFELFYAFGLYKIEKVKKEVFDIKYK